MKEKHIYEIHHYCIEDKDGEWENIFIDPPLKADQETLDSFRSAIQDLFNATSFSYRNIQKDLDK